MYYQRLSALDASFIDIEDVNVHMHVAAALVFDGGPLATAEGGLDMERIRAYIGSRLHLIPRYRQRIAWIPFERHPVWVDDNRFNLFYHVRHASLPRPGTERQLKRFCGRVMSQKLDLTKPLWEIWVVEGLSEGRFALVAKVHHCMVDGISGVDLLTVLLSPIAEASHEPAPPWEPRPAPDGVDLLFGELRRRAGLPIAAFQAARRLATDPTETLSRVRSNLAAVAEAVSAATTPASELPFNPPHIGPHRRFDWAHLDMAAVKEVKGRLGGTVNDVVLASVTGAVRRYLGRRGTAPDALDFRAMIPVNVRAASERGSLGNRVAQMVAPLSLAQADPRRAFRDVVEATGAVKRSHQVEATELIEEIGDWTATAVLTRLIRLTAARRPYNLVVTNVPGPPVPLYLLGAPLRESYPMVPLFQNQGLGIALFSYAGGLYWGISGDWDAVPDLHDFVVDIEHSFRDLHRAALAGGAEPRQRPRRSASARRPAGRRQEGR